MPSGEDEPPRATVSKLLDALLSSLRLAFVLARLNDPSGGPSLEIIRFGPTPQNVGSDELTFVSAHLGLHGELGVLVAASRERDFPRATEKLQIDLAATQTAVALALDRAREFRLLVDTIPALVWRGTAEGDLDFLNQRAVEYLGHTAESLSKGRWLDVIHPDHRDATVRRWMQAVTTGTSYDDVYQLRRADGRFRWTRSIGEPLRDANGRIVQWYGVIVDIEERKRIEEELRRSEAFLAQAQRLTLTGSIWWEVATGEVIWSDEMFRLMDVARTTKPNLDLAFSRVHPEDRSLVRELLERAASEGVNMDFEHRLLMPNGTVKHVHVVLQNIGQPGKPEYVGAMTNVTARKEVELENVRAEEALNLARAELAHVARLATLNTLAASITHEVNQPLTGIITNVSTCRRMLDADPPDFDGAREAVTRTIRDSNRTADVIKRLREMFTRKEFTLESLDLNAATREVIALATGELQRERIVLRFELAEDLPAITGDRIQVQQVILNLLRNAAEAMAVRDRPRHLTITTRRDGDFVRLSVRDTGPGFDPHLLDKLFDAFYTTKSDGMGIGLSVSRSIIETHHGRLWAELNDGPGATFSFAIPVNMP